ncbi:MAG TPA: hypothetical protein PLY16_02430 [Candidatus Saccharibacteria bacterium]|nr:hypothetical protein [Candidatus Saccharibacteria bacterium]
MGRKLKKSSGGAGIIVLVVAIVAVVLAAVTYIFVTLTFGPPETLVTNFDECVAAKGSSLLESYPEQCVTSDGRSFVNPHQEL